MSSTLILVGRTATAALLAATIAPLLHGQSRHLAQADHNVAGTVAGSHIDTHASDGVYESVTEQETGGKPSRRQSYLEHKWRFDLPAASSAQLFVQAFHTSNSEGDDFEFAWAHDRDGTFRSLSPPVIVTGTTPPGTYSSGALPISGAVWIRVIDTDRTRGHRSLDTLSVDHLYIESSSASVPPSAPSELVAGGVAADEVEVSWTDNSGNEDGFRLQRSLDAIDWSLLTTTAANVTSYRDTGLAAGTTYYYRAQAFNGHGDSAWSDTAVATTWSEPAFIVDRVDTGSDKIVVHAYDSTGLPAVAYSAGEAVKLARFDGVNWNSENTGFTTNYGPDLAFASSGAPALAFTTKGGGRQKYPVAFAERVGSTWQLELLAAKCPANYVSLTYDQLGNPSIAYWSQGSNASGEGLNLIRRIGGVWINSHVFQVPWHMHTYVSHAYDAVGDPWIAFPANDFLMLAHWNGTGWDVETIESGGNDADLAFEPGTGWPAITHWQTDGVENRIRYLRWSGTSWSGETVASTTVAATAEDCRLAYDASGTPHICYGRWALDSYVVFLLRWTGTSWQEDYVDDGYVHNIDLMIDPAGNPSLSYETVPGGQLVNFAHK